MLARLAALGPQRRRLLAEALLALLVAAMRVRLLPFARLTRHLGPLRPPQPRGGPGEAGAAEAVQVRWAIGALVRRLPLAPACLAQALAAQVLCRRRGLPVILHLGAQQGQALDGQTHAWLDAAGVQVTGYPLPADMVEVGCFTP